MQTDVTVIDVAMRYILHLPCSTYLKGNWECIEIHNTICFVLTGVGSCKQPQDEILLAQGTIQ